VVDAVVVADRREPSSGPGVTALYSVRHRCRADSTDPVRVSEEGLDVAISVVTQVEDLTGEEDAALLAALGLEGSPPGGGRIRLDGPQGGGRRIVGQWDSDTDYERFRDDRLMPALRSLGRTLQIIEKWPATETVRILPVT
jgi:hypothetical protein